MTSRIVSYWAPGNRDASEEEWRLCQRHLHRSALAHGGVDESDPWELGRIRDSEFYRRNRDILTQPRGAGYWLWKPYIILESLKSMAAGDFVIYHDIGKPRQDMHKRNRFFRDVSPGLEFTRLNGGIFPGVYVPRYGPNKAWIKRDCFILMGCDAPLYWQHCQIQATYNVWQVRPETIDFVEQWLAFCEDPRILTDQPNEMGEENWPAFIDHRHDQAVLTNLCLSLGVGSLGSPRETIYRHRNFNFFVEAWLRQRATHAGE